MRPRKYRNQPTHIDGLRFDSRKEGRRYGELKLLAQAGEIQGLEVHPVFKLFAHGPDGPVGGRRYTADFRYREGNKDVVEDVKSEPTKRTEAYRLRRWLFLANYPHIDFREV